MQGTLMADPNEELESELDLEDEAGDPAGEDTQEGEDSGGADEIAARAPPDDRTEIPPSRRDARIQRLLDEKRQQQAELQDVRQRLDQLSSQRFEANQARQETDAERAARYDGMSQGEAIAQALRESEFRFAQRMNAATVQTAEMQDKQAFETRVGSDKLYAYWAPKVEAKLAE